MCGITGFLDESSRLGADGLRAQAERMAALLAHRGPDDRGTWADEETGLALGHRRLSIIDLSPAGAQPMHSSCGRYVIVFNGEVFNHRVLREELERGDKGLVFRGHSDTEVMLTAISRWGVEAAVKRFIGMFAFALWDRQERVLHLVRDRLGIKPLYYGWVGKSFVFGSELKAFGVCQGFPGEVNRDVVALYFRMGYVPGPHSIYRDIYKLMPGCILSIRPADSRTGRDSFSAFPSSASGGNVHLHPVSFWSVDEVAQRGLAAPFAGSPQEAVDDLDRLLRDAVKLRMEADVPLGAFLSGGVDSSTVVALMQAQSNRPVKTFSIGYREAAYDEAQYGRAVARHLGTDHVELYVTPEDALDVIPRLPDLYDEPFADSSQIPTFLVSKLARQSVTVSLSGDGGDELFCGYSRYHTNRAFSRGTRWMPNPVRRGLAGVLTSVPTHWLDRSLGWMRPALRRRGAVLGSVGNALHQAAAMLVPESPEELYLHQLSRWKDPLAVVKNAREPYLALTDLNRIAVFPQGIRRLMFLDSVTFLPDDDLAKVDRASMGVSLEVRVPILDHRVFEWAWKLPLSMHVQHGRGKWVLRKVLSRYVPDELIERPKMGFAVPVGVWLRGRLRDWTEALLDEKRLDEGGFVNPQLVRACWTDHLSGKRDCTHELWTVLQFQAWHRHAFGEKV